MDGLKLALDAPEGKLIAKAAAVLRLRPAEIRDLRIARRSLDARETVQWVYSVYVQVKDEESVLRRCKSPQVTRMADKPYVLPPMKSAKGLRPVVVGAGPAGLFCALTLARCGVPPILLERGRPVEERKRAVERFWQTGVLDPHSNVQFGEGGAGAFSDGKLNTGTRDPRHRWILRELVQCGAPSSILTEAQPHVGTDYLYRTLQALRKELMTLGCDLRFSHRLTGITQAEGQLTGITVESPDGTYALPCDTLVLAVGHSARDTFAALYEQGVPMEAKAFSVGVRIEHRQSAINASQYRQFAGHPSLPASSYKLSCHLDNGRGVYSFCVCPGGQVVAAASEEGRLVTNGMSCYARDLENCNGGLLVSVTPEDFGSEHPLAGIAFQRRLEEDAFRLGGGDYCAPAQRVGDFLAGQASTEAGQVHPSYRPGVRFTDLSLCLPAFVCDSLREALPLLERKLHGFADPDAVLTAVETRSSSPVRLPRSADGQAAVRGLYPCGEGAGYAGGILSAAADGMRTAEHILRRYGGCV